MWISAEIALKSYLPIELEEGMLFINRIFLGVVEPYIELWELDYIPEDMDAFMSEYGAPIELLIISEDGKLLATHDEIGWWDDGHETDELRDITLDDINYLLKELDGYVEIEIDDDTEDLIIYESKIVLGLEEDIPNDWDVTLNDGLEEE